MPSLVIFIVLLLGIMMGMLAGLIICANTDLGDFAFTDTRRDLVKCAVVSVVIAAAGAGLFQLGQNARVVFGLAPLFYLGLKLSWLDISTPEVVVTGFTSVLAIAVTSTIAFMVLV